MRTPIEELVRERVPELRAHGRLWTACCPFHDEKTPSFKVDPSRGTWRCYGACQDGGDVLRFVERFDRLTFVEALELLAGRVGLQLPERRPGERAGKDALEPLYEVLARATEFYARELRGPRGAAALEYCRGRGLRDETIAAFGLGFAPAEGDALVRRATQSGQPFAVLEQAGLARRSERGRSYDFFRERLTIPIRDGRGRTVGFGARRLADSEASGPKYVNTAETALFHKGRLIYALDRAIERVRREGRLILMEGYTDVMAAHQIGSTQVVAVLGTAFTDEHAALVRRTGAKRITLVFDGDSAGRRAAHKALAGLLPLGIEIDVATPPAGQDPCDVCTRGGAAAFEAMLGAAKPWMEFLFGDFAELSGSALAAALDELLGLVHKIGRALHREACLSEIAVRLGYPLASVREQYESMRERRRAPRPEGAVRAEAGPAAEPARGAAQVRRAWGELAGAALLDATLLPLVRPWIGACPDAELAAILGAIAAAADRSGQAPDESGVLTELGEHPARRLVGPILSHASRAESPLALFEGATQYLAHSRGREGVRLQKTVALHEAESDADLERTERELHRRLREMKIPGAAAVQRSRTPGLP